MSTQTETLSTDHSQAEVDGAHSHGEAPVISTTSRADRLSSFVLDDFAMPTGREEEWRFSPVRSLQGLFAADFTGARPQVTLDGDDRVTLEEVAADDARFGRRGSSDGSPPRVGTPGQLLGRHDLKEHVAAKEITSTCAARGWDRASTTCSSTPNRSSKQR